MRLRSLTIFFALISLIGGHAARAENDFPCQYLLATEHVDQLAAQVDQITEQYALHKSSCLFDKDFVLPKEGTPQNILNGELRPNWAQEYVGMDLAAELLRSEGVLSKKVSVGVLDAGFEKQHLLKQPAQVLAKDALVDEHGTLATNIIAEQPSAYISGMGCWDPIAKGVRCIQDSGKTRVVNMSLTLVASEKGENIAERPDIKALENVMDDGSLLVISAGNKHPHYKVQDLKEHLAKKDRAIIVGSMSPLGYPSDMSQQSEAVFINAPSDYYIMVPYNADGRLYEGFRGTSGAAPMVSAGLTYPLAILPELSNSELLELMKRSMLPTPNFYAQTKLDGQGTLNAYKALRVALKIRSACETQLSPKSCMGSAVRDPSFYQFDLPVDEQRLLNEQSNQAYPQCMDEAIKKPSSANSSCEFKRSVLKRIREVAFLNPMDKGAWKKLACIYQAEGYVVDATFYELMSQGHDGNIKTLEQYLFHPNTSIQSMAVWALTKYGDKGRQILGRQLHSNGLNPGIQAEINQALDIKKP